VNNFIRIMAMKEENAERSIFVSERKEGGINLVYDPMTQGYMYQVFIHNSFPYSEVGSWEFPTFQAARSFAAEHFAKDWELFFWNGDLNRPCKNEECGSGRSGKCQECAAGGGCSACGATEEVKFD
jgi:hypothetical protein